MRAAFERPATLPPTAFARYLRGMLRTPQAALLIILPMVSAGGGEQSSSTPPIWSFGIGLATSANSQPFGLYLVKEHGLHIVETQPITREQFVLQAQGMIVSKANPGAENLLLKYGVSSCYHPSDSMIPVRDCVVFDDIWKLRFWEYPFKTQGPPRQGWAEKRETPSPRQMLLLSEYGIMNLSSVTRGEYTFKLLRDMGDSSWVDNYRKGY